MENQSSSSKQSLVVLGYLVKRHSFKENKWKVSSCSGQASTWLSQLDECYINTKKISVRVEVPENNGSEFFVYFEESFEPHSKDEFCVERSKLPELGSKEIYLLDLMGAEVLSDQGIFKVLGFLENGDPSVGVTATNLILENSNSKIEVPLAVLSKKENTWFVNDVALWIDLAYSSDKKVEHEED